MQVNWKGSFQSEKGKEKITLGVPEGLDDELHIIKKAVQAGKKLSLVVEDENTPKFYNSVVDYIAEIVDNEIKKSKEEGYKQGLREAAEEMEKTLITQ
jgi:hypothetical protein